MDNNDRLSQLREALRKPYMLPEDRRAALKLAWNWIKDGTFNFREFESVMDIACMQGYREREDDEQEEL